MEWDKKCKIDDLKRQIYELEMEDDEPRTDDRGEWAWWATKKIEELRRQRYHIEKRIKNIYKRSWIFDVNKDTLKLYVKYDRYDGVGEKKLDKQLLKYLNEDIEKFLSKELRQSGGKP